MRYLVSLIAGIFLGAMCAVTVANVIAQRHAWPRAVMNVMQHELGVARDAVRENHCAAADADIASKHLELLSQDIELALLPPGSKDHVFTRYAKDLRDAVAGFAQGGDCAARREALTKVSHACDACHRDYR